MFKRNKIVPEGTLDRNDPIQARIYENILNIVKIKPKKKEENKKIKKSNR